MDPLSLTVVDNAENLYQRARPQREKGHDNFYTAYQHNLHDGCPQHSPPLPALRYMRPRCSRDFPASPSRATQASRANSPIPQLVPGSSQRFLDKSRSLTADCLAYDLEDSVTPHMKAEARSLVRRAIDQSAPQHVRERAVRINSVDSGLALGDLTEVVCSHRKGPKLSCRS